MTDSMFLAAVEVLVEDRGQSERAAWCFNAAGADVSWKGMSKV